ncbi:MAG: glycosyltransferase family 4 protein [Lachnospiraceae bacterium]|nr:glycosyltransferase family 4 protein [Lachnospiraceae bacterium]MCI9341805.1 glycosyltransferase family 4 protein [Lachnospiraceae bacterium]
MSRLFIYDTSNFIDFPIGGQLTSIGNFLRFICEEHPERTEDIVLVGVTLCQGEIGKIKKINLYGRQISFLPVTTAEKDLGNTASSLRLRYVKGLLKCRKLLKIAKRDCNYVHSPEAYGIVKLFCPVARCVIFSHGSYFNMERGFRFFRKNLLVKKGFVLYLKWVLRSANLILLLDKDSLRDYKPYNSNLVQVGNSIICPELPEGRHVLREGKVREILFVGRLSKDKRVEPIIRAVEGMGKAGFGEEGSGMDGSEIRLTIVGDGEEYHNLIPYAGERIRFVGAVPPKEVKEYMQNSDILVMNSSFEGVPMTILEAISYGLPVVSTNVGGIGEALHFGQDSEETDGTEEGIQAAIRRIEAHYDVYSRNAYENSKAYDYRTLNRKVYDLLCGYWGC